MITNKIFVLFLFQMLDSAKGFDDEANIIGGSEVSINEFPYQASIRIYGKHTCGGAIISIKHILTAAHCINDVAVPPFSHVKIVTGTSSPISIGQSHSIRRIDIYPEYSEHNSYKNDIAIITLFRSMVFNNVQKLIELPILETHDFSNGIVTGWGLTNFPSNTLPTTLQKLDVVTITNEECQKCYEDYIYPVHLCGYSGSEIGICIGDSGSPLVVNGKVVGIASWITPCAMGKPDIYTRVFDYLSFIQSIIRI